MSPEKAVAPIDGSLARLGAEPKQWEGQELDTGTS